MLYVRLAAAAVLAVALAGTHWKAYTSGQKDIQARWDADITQRTAEALADSEKARAKEQTLQAENRRIANAYAAEKTRRAAADVAAADSLRRLESALAGNYRTPDDPAATSGVDDDPRDGIIAQCGSALVQLGAAHRGLVAQTKALQEYTARVCVRPPDE